MVQFHTLLILFTISFTFISIAYAEAQDEFAVKSRHARSTSDIGSDSGDHGFHRHTRTMTISQSVPIRYVMQRRIPNGGRFRRGSSNGYAYRGNLGHGYGGGYRLWYSGLGYGGLGYGGLGYSGGYFGRYLWQIQQWIGIDMVVIDMDTKNV